MRLVRLEIENYRSVQSQRAEDAITFAGRDCLVGRNNAGKSNILEAIAYLLGEETVSRDHYYKHDTSLDIEVTGFFRLEDSDIARLSEVEYETISDFVLDESVVGICRRNDSRALEVVGRYPSAERLKKPAFERCHERAWTNREGGAHFRDTMLEEYPELEPYLTDGKETNMGEWTDAYERFVKARPRGVELVETSVSADRDVSNIIDKLLPSPIIVPAVKEVSDATKTSTRGEFGVLLGKLSSEIEEELDEAIDQAMADVYRTLNLVIDGDTGEVRDERHEQVKALENRITGYLAETFQDISVLLRFPNPESHDIFSNAQVLIREPGLREMNVECEGEGVKRVLVFSLIRTLADLRQGKLAIAESQNDSESNEASEEEPPKPLLILYEEAELFLHPGMQRILLKAFGDLEGAGDQVIFTTHSPFMLRQSLSTINLVKKNPHLGTQVVEFHRALEARDEPSRNRLLQIQNVSSYMFADRVLLVEGVSDRIVLKKLVPRLKPEWDFERCGIPVLPVIGKGDLPLFKDFLRSLGIETFVVTDIDAIKTTALRLCTDTSLQEEVREVKDRLWDRARRLAEEDKFRSRINKGYAQRLANGYRWSRVFDNLESLYLSLTEGGNCDDEQLGCLEKLLLKREEDAKRKALRCDDEVITDLRCELKELLLEEDVLILTGDIEDYYPNGSSTAKIKSAINFDPGSYELDELCDCFATLRDATDMEVFLHRLFEAD